MGWGRKKENLETEIESEKEGERYYLKKINKLT